MMLLSSCGIANQNSQEALCAGTAGTREDHANSLVAFGEAIIGIGAGEVITTGATLIGSIDAGCK